MAGVVVWCYKNNKNLWIVYEPNVSCELERLFCLGTQQTVNLGTFSPNLSNYEVNFVQMTQVTIQSGSVREVKRVVCDSASAAAKGVIWQFEGDIPSHWVTYDLKTMDVIEQGFTNRNLIGSSFLDLQQSVLQLPYIIDFGVMTQMRVETGRVRQIQRRPLTQAFSPAASHPLGTSMLPASSMFAGSSGQVGWQSGQLAPIIPSIKSKRRYQPYTVNGGFHGLGAQANISSTGLQQQQPSQHLGPVTRRKFQQTSAISSTNPTSTLHQQPHMQLQQSAPASTLHQQSHMQLQQQPAPTSTLHQQSHMQLQQQPAPTSTLHQQPHMQLQQQPAPAQMYQSPPHSFFHQALHNFQMSGPFQHLLGHIPGTLTSFLQYPSSSLPQPLAVSSVHQPLSHHQMSRPSTTSLSLSVPNPQTLESLPTISKVSIGKSRRTKGKTGIEVLKDYISSIYDNLDAADCSICCNKLSEASSYGEGQADALEAVELNRCRHQFHKLCLLEMYNSIHKDDSLQCPSCKMIYGEKTGNCPPGYMSWRVVNDLTLPGYEGNGTIIVSYHISPGTQGPEHPSPGQVFTARGFPRQGFLPDCCKGRKVLKLLMEAFRRRLMFTIATSSTTGEINTVTWNEIHHKTEPHGNRSGHGYPDPHYLDNVLMELASHGVTEDCLR